MTAPQIFTNWRDIALKLGSNIVSRKIWISAVATIALFSGDINGAQWVLVVGGLFGIGEILKPSMAKSLVDSMKTNAPVTSEGETDGEIAEPTA